MSIKITSLDFIYMDLLLNHKEENYEQEKQTEVFIDGIVFDFGYACWMWFCG